MWGYTLAATRLHVRHYVWQSLQTEPSALWHSALEGSPHIYHYTFGLEFSSDGLPVTTIGDWSLDKRHYMSTYPPRQLEMPDKCAGQAALTLTRLFNEATSNISDWPVGSPSAAVRGTRGWGDGGVGGGVIGGVGGPAKGVGVLTDAIYRRSSLAQAVVQRGPWKWGGQSPVLFYRKGRLYTPWGTGRWSLAGDAISVSLGPCGTWRLAFNAARTAFTASTGRGVPPSSRGMLMAPDGSDTKPAGGGGKPAAADDGGGADDDNDDDDDDDDGGEEAEAEAAAAQWRRMSDARFYRNLLGSGPWAWQGVSPIAFLGGGHMHTPWGLGTWEVHPTQPSTIYANFVNQKHAVTFGACWSFTSVRQSDGDRAAGTGKIDAPPKDADACPQLRGH